MGGRQLGRQGMIIKKKDKDSALSRYAAKLILKQTSAILLAKQPGYFYKY